MRLYFEDELLTRKDVFKFLHHALPFLLYSTTRHNAGECRNWLFCNEDLEFYDIRHTLVKKFIGKRCVSRGNVLHLVEEATHKFAKWHLDSKFDTAIEMGFGGKHIPFMVMERLDES